MSFYRDFNLMFQDVILIGCGGTGSRVVAPLIQTIKQAQAKINPCLWLVDGDIFEESNLTRQNCIKRDLGRNKAVVLAERYGIALEFPVVAMDEYVEFGSSLYCQLSDYARHQGKNPIRQTRKLVIMCVDSIDARLKILSNLNPEDIVIDAGNEDTFGQVSIFDLIAVTHLNGDRGVDADIKPFSGEHALRFIPAPANTYLEALVNPTSGTGSCATLDQSLAINNLMAAGIVNFVQNLAYNNPFYCRTQYYDLIRGHSAERMTNVWFNQVMNETKLHDNDVISTWSKIYATEVLGASTFRGTFTLDTLIDIEENITYIDPKILALLGK